MCAERLVPHSKIVPILALRNSVLFPMSVVPVNVGRPRSVRLIEEHMDATGTLLGVVTQRTEDTLEPTFEDLYKIGTLARIVKVIRLNSSSYSVVLNGISRFRINEFESLEPFMQAHVERLVETGKTDPSLPEITSRLRDATRDMLMLQPDLPKETSSILDNVRDPGALADLIASNFSEEHANIGARQQVLECVNVLERVQLVFSMVERHVGILRASRALAVDEMGKSQRDLVLRQQMRTIRDALGEGADDDEVERLRERVQRAEMPDEAERAAKKQLRRLATMPQQSAEYQVARNYVEWLADLPWSRSTTDRMNVVEVRRCLEEDHYGLERVKRRIVEFSAIRQLRKDRKGPILLFVGPPGVGKTSLGRSIARAMGRKYGRIALGGVRDEAEVRGHRRTYVGALPGRIIQALKKVGSNNPVLVLDEVDKMGTDMRGDPAAALLEALDPEQNDTFTDHFIDVPFDLSKVLFLATANIFNEIPVALADRMEVIEVPGYTRSEKLGIATQFLVPKQLREHGINEERLRFLTEGIEHIIDYYTREAGVRNLEREIAAVCRAVTVRMAEGEDVAGAKVTPEMVEQVLGTHKVHPEIAERRLAPGIATGLGVSGAGGDILYVEATRMPGKGKVRTTGSLGKVLSEAADAAVSYVRSHAVQFGIEPEWLSHTDLHVHLPRAYAIQDSAAPGLAICAAVTSLLVDVPLRPKVAITGEVTLRGAILRVHGIKDQLLAAHRAGLTEVILPESNRVDIEELPAAVRDDLTLHWVKNVNEVLELIFDSRPPSMPPPKPTTENGDSVVL
jgi:ATP-dependent Lon protease